MGWQDRLKVDNQNIKWHAYTRFHARAVHSVAPCCHVTTDLNNNSLSTNVPPPRKSFYCPSSPSISLMRCCRAWKTRPNSRRCSSSLTPCTCTAMKMSGQWLWLIRDVINISRKALDKWQPALLFQYPVCRHCGLHPAVLCLQCTGTCKAAEWTFCPVW